MYNRSATIYDAIYQAQGKDYAGEVQKLSAVIEQYKQSDGNSLLDVACGTGGHLAYLRRDFKVEGLDKSEEMLIAARDKFPEINFHHADMVDFEINHFFDIITCLFSAIGYTKTLPQLSQTIKTMTSHLLRGGVIIVEPWFGPGVLDIGKVHAIIVDEPELKVARMNINRVEGNISYLDFHYMVATPNGIEYFSETHTLGLFTNEEYLQSFQAAGLKTIRDLKGLDGRGLYIGIKS